MKIYIEDLNGALKPVSLRDVLAEAIAKGMGVEIEDKMDVNKHSDGSGSWVEVKQSNEDNTLEISVLILFNDEGNRIEDIKVYKTPIKTIIDHDETTSII